MFLRKNKNSIKYSTTAFLLILIFAISPVSFAFAANLNNDNSTNSLDGNGDPSTSSGGNTIIQTPQQQDATFNSSANNNAAVVDNGAGGNSSTDSSGGSSGGGATGDVGGAGSGIAVCIGTSVSSVSAASAALEAQDAMRVPVADRSNRVISTVSAGNETAHTFKSCVLDPLAYMLARRAIDQITIDTINWINNGFQGSPAFVQNPTKFLTGVGDKVVGDILANSRDFSFLCAPFRLPDFNIGLNIVLGHSDYVGLTSSCTLTGVIANAENFAKFTSGDWSQGGWNSFIQVTQVPSNDPFYAQMALSADIDRAVSNKQGEQLNILNWGAGFMSMTDSGGNIITPGHVIENKLEQTMGTDVRQLELADSFDKIVSALLNQLINQAIFSSKGLAGSK